MDTMKDEKADTDVGKFYCEQCKKFIDRSK